MQSDPLIVVWQSYGWLGFLGYVLVREVWPFVRGKVWPEAVRQAKVERERIGKLEERQLAVEDRQVAAVEAMSRSVHEMAMAIVTNNERLAQVIAGQAIHAKEMSDAIALMRERTGSPAMRAKQ